MAEPRPEQPRQSTEASEPPASAPDDATSTPKAKPPLLASEALMEDLAPVEPARRAARMWCAVVGVGFIALGVLFLTGLRPGGRGASYAAFALGAISLVAALTRVTYRQRAVAMVVLGILCTLLDLQSIGPTGLALGHPGWRVARAVVAATLPAALLFRARYRAYSGARWLLAAAFGAALPLVAYAVIRILRLEFNPQLIGASLVVIAVLASLSGFMGSETVGPGLYLVVAVILALAADLALVGFTNITQISVQNATNIIVTALAFAATSALTSLGLFQILAWRLAADARRINIHSPPKERQERPPSSADWLS